MSIAAFYAEAERIFRDVPAVISKHKLWLDETDSAEEFVADLRAAFGTGPDLFAVAMRSTDDADVRKRIEAANTALAYYFNHSMAGMMDAEWKRAMFAMRDALAGLKPFTDAEPADGKPEGEAEPKPASNVSLDAKALALFIEHPEWTKVRIADELRCNEKSLSPRRCPKLAAAIKAHNARIDPGRRTIRGSKDVDHNIEAWEDE